MTPKAPISPQLDLLFKAERPAAKAASAVRSRGGGTWLVHQLVAEARDLVEGEFGDVWVEGEISNCRPASSGHLYFTLKDVEAQLPVVLFRRQAMLLRFRPEDGLHVRVRGKVSVYEQRGQLQLVAETMEPVGAGSLQLAFEQLRDKLKAEGLFEQERKRPLPVFPRTVAIVTSPTGAVVRDFLNIVKRRHSGLNVVVIPAAVQGDNAIGEIVAALAKANEPDLADVIVLARGGGSLEDLAVFNSERVARAIAGSGLPVVSAVGHETDFTIADFVADLRAPTPSAAAELITEAQHNVEELVAGLWNRLSRATRFQLLRSRQRLDRLAIARAEQSFAGRLHREEQRLDDFAYRLELTVSETLRRHQLTVSEMNAAVLRHDPRQQLGTARETLASSLSRLHYALERSLISAGHERRHGENRLYRAAQVAIAVRRAVYHSVQVRLKSLSPLAVLKRGYALVQDQNGLLVRSVGQIGIGQAVQTRLGYGSFVSNITETNPNRKKKDKKNPQ